jgi:TonB-linked SusC/RagA family outer membrane protein
MRTKLKGLLTLVLALVVQITFAQQKVTGTVVDASTGEPLPGVNILIEGTQNGTTTDFDGKFSITASPGDVLLFSYVGYQNKKVTVGNQGVINVKMTPGETLTTVVVNIAGAKKTIKTISYAVQQLKADKLEISDISNVSSALNGKIAGTQVLDQAGSKLGSGSKIRIRGRISLSTDSNPLYVVDGTPVSDPSLIDPDDVETMEVLKGPNATAIYGQRGENGVVVITTKSGKKGIFGVDVNSKVTFEKIAYLPKYQNWYGEGYAGDGEWLQYDHNAAPYNWGFSYDEWAAPEFQGAYFIKRTYADESWGPKFDGRDYMPWYSWIPGSPYFGKTAKWEAQPNNVKDFYDTGVYVKNNIALYSGSDKYKARLSFSNLDQKGVIPYSTYKRYYLSTNFSYNITDKFKVGTTLLYSKYNRHGDFDDGYANQTSGSFNQWFARQANMKIQKELMDLKTPEGYLTSWNWWGPFYLNLLAGINYISPESAKKPVFWFNPYTWLDRYDRNGKGNQLSGNFWGTYDFTDNLNLKLSYQHYENNGFSNFHMPYEIEYSSAHDAFTSYVNSFGEYQAVSTEDDYNAFLNYVNKELTDNISLDVLLGTTLRVNHYNSKSLWMGREDMENGLIIPDVYRFDNTKKPVTANLNASRKKVYSLFTQTTMGYKDLLFLEMSVRRDWSSALFPEHNGYTYPSVGLAFNFTKLDAFKDNKFISDGKFRLGWAQVGSDVSAHLIYPRFRFLSGIPYNGSATLVTPSYTVDPNLKPALNSSFETGFDVKLFDNRMGVNFTYYYEKRKDEIIFQTITGATGYGSYLTKGGISHRSGIELSLNGEIMSSDDFTWSLALNFNKNKSIVDELPDNADEMVAPGGRWWSDGDTWGRITLVHKKGEEWGQLKGYDIKRDDNGNPVLTSTGLYIPEEKYFGSVLPDFTGGFTNTFQYKNFKLAAHFTFQKGGKFFSGSEIWGWYSGLYEETGMDGNREAGMDVSGVDNSGNSVEYNLAASDYYKQFHDNNIAGPFIHDASYLKLRELSLSYTLPKKYTGKYLKGATVSLIGTNLWLISVSKDNYHRWDPSELSQTYGEDGQLPGTKRYGISIKLKF